MAGVNKSKMTRIGTLKLFVLKEDPEGIHIGSQGGVMMKHRSVIAALVVAACLWIGCSSAFAATVVWQTEIETAVRLAKAQGKNILLLMGRDGRVPAPDGSPSLSCARTETMKYGVVGAELSATYPVTAQINTLVNNRYIPYYIYADAKPYDFWSTYGKGIRAVSFELPLICVIDPNNPDACMQGSRAPDQHDFTSNFQLFYNTLQQFATTTPSCTATISPSAHTFNPPSGSSTIGVASPAGCSWTASSNKTWITITAGATGAGPGTVSYTVSANAGDLREGTITVGGQPFTVTQNGAPGSCASTISPTSASFKASPTITIGGPTGNKGTVAVESSCSWSAATTAAWITITAGATGAGNGTVSYTVSANTGIARTGTMTIGGQTLTVTQEGTTANTPLYFPYVDTSLHWQTEIALINTGNQSVSGTLRAFRDDGTPIEVETMPVTLSAHGRIQVNVANAFTDPVDIRYFTFDTNSAAVQGYMKLYQSGSYRAAIPAVRDVNTSSTIYLSHIASDAQWWTGVVLLNTTSARKDLTITFDNGQSASLTLNANEQKVFDIAQEFFDGLPQPGIRSAEIANAVGVIGLEIFGSPVGNQLDGIIITGYTASTIYYPHVAGGEWWTGIVAYNTAASEGTITITSYDADGNLLPTSSIPPLPGKGKYIGTFAELAFPAKTAWFKIDSTTPMTGFELFGTTDLKELAAYAGGGQTGAKTGVFPKIEKNGTTTIAFVNTEADPASVTLTAYRDDGSVVATKTLPPVGGHAKVYNSPELIFAPQDISSASYIAYTSDRNIVGFQLNGTSNGPMLDALPALAGAAN
ncbi:MAG: BACON domain-containing protein [Syntrophales bacterium]